MYQSGNEGCCARCAQTFRRSLRCAKVFYIVARIKKKNPPKLPVAGFLRDRERLVFLGDDDNFDFARYIGVQLKLDG